MSAIRLLRTRRENTVQKRDATLPGGDLDPRPGPHLDQNVLGQLRRGSLGLDSGLSGGLFSAARKVSGQSPLPYLAQTWHSKIEIRDQTRK